MLGLLAAVEVAVPDGSLRRTLECVVTIVMVAAMGIWVRVNRVALEIAESGVARRPAVIASSRTPPRPPATTRRSRG